MPLLLHWSVVSFYGAMPSTFCNFFFKTFFLNFFHPITHSNFSPLPAAIERAMPDMNPKDLGLLRESSRLSGNMLDSDSTFIGEFMCHIFGL